MRTSRVATTLLYCALAILGFRIPTLSAARYSVIDLGTLGGASAQATSINDNGQVTGWASTTLSSSGIVIDHAFLWQAGTMSDLGTLASNTTGAGHINLQGQVVGSSVAGDYPANQHALWWHDGTIKDLLPQSNRCLATSINECGDIVGEDYGKAVVWHSGTVQYLPSLGGESTALDISNPGWIVGYSHVSAVQYRACLWRDGVAQNLGTLTANPGYGSLAYAVNDAGQVVGYSWKGANELHAFVWQDDTMTDLGTLAVMKNSLARGINAWGDIVGASYSSGVDSRAVVWQEGVPTDLNNLIPAGSGWTLQSATSINSLGQIVGYGSNRGGNRAFLLTPVPEPATLISILVGIGFLAAGRNPRLRRP